ncbi:response regulator transcription factor [Microbacterium sp.]|uniref:response regulator transcription factor n=1 Tax=Microbacterium sp. TaxID=51671 RepID=UPI0039E677E4
MRLLLVEDERELADTLAEGLRREGYAVEVAYDGRAALAAVAAADIELMVLDRDLPVLTGDAVCRTLRAQRHPVRILMLTAAGGLDDRVTGLDLGADDYLAKPFAYLELLARLRALGRRVHDAAPVMEAAGVRCDTARRLVERDGRPVAVTRKELAVLETLLTARGGYVSVDELRDEVWQGEGGRTVVKATVHTLRRKLGHPDPIDSAPGLGYRMRELP